MGGKILAINEGFGYRPILVVHSFNFLPQLNDRAPSTFVYGDQIMFMTDRPTDYVSFLRKFFGQELVWSQLGMANDTEEQIVAIWPKMPLKLVMNESLRILRAGKDPIAGYYVQFDGPIRLFSQHEWWKDHEEYAE